MKSLKIINQTGITNELVEANEAGALIFKYIVSILGADLSNSDSDTNETSMRLFMEYCDEGNLLDYINSFKNDEHILKNV